MTAEDVVSVFVKRALERRDQCGIADAQPDSLRRQFDMRLAIDPDTPLDTPPARQIPTLPDEQPPGIAIEQVDPGVFSLEPSDDVDDETSERLDTLVEQLAVRLPHVTVQREDRELIILTDPNTTPEALRTLVDHLWTA